MDGFRHPAPVRWTLGRYGIRNLLVRNQTPPATPARRVAGYRAPLPSPRTPNAFNIPFLSRYDAFNGPNHDEHPREKGYIRGDGEHPTELASEYTAKLLPDIGYRPVMPP